MYAPKRRKKSSRRGARRSYVDLVQGLAKESEAEEIQKKNQTKEDLEQIEKEAAAGGRKGRRTAKDLIFRTVYLNTLHQW